MRCLGLGAYTLLHTCSQDPKTRACIHTHRLLTSGETLVIHQYTPLYRHSKVIYRNSHNDVLTVCPNNCVHTAYGHSPSFSSQPSLSGLKKVCVRSLPSSSGILKGSFLMLSYRFLSRSSGKSPPSFMPLFMEMNRSTDGLSFTFGLWRLVFSMMMANDRM